MQNTSELYRQIITGNHWFEISLAIGDSGRLIDERGNVLLFGDTAILVDSGGAESAFRESVIFKLTTSHAVFPDKNPSVGNVISGEIDIQIEKPLSEIPKKARLVPFVRACNETQQSEWLQKGVYYVDTRSTSDGDNDLKIMTIHGYDAIMSTEQDYPSDSEHDYPMLDVDMVSFIANSIGVRVDQRTVERMNKGYKFPIMAGYSMRETLGRIASAYGGNFIMSDLGELLLITLSSLPKETNYLIDEYGDILLFGDTKILV